MSDKKLKTRTDPMLLPASTEDIEKFVLDNRMKMYVHTIKIIEQAIDAKEPIAELYKFTGSHYVVVMKDTDYKDNLDFIFEELIKREEYEICAYAKNVKEKVDKLVLTLRTNYITK